MTEKLSAFTVRVAREVADNPGLRLGQNVFNAMCFCAHGAEKEQLNWAAKLSKTRTKEARAANCYFHDKKIPAFIAAAIAAGVLEDDTAAEFTPRRLPKEELDAAFEEGHRRAEKLRAQTAGMTRRVDYEARCKELEVRLKAAEARALRAEARADAAAKVISDIRTELEALGLVKKAT